MDGTVAGQDAALLRVSFAGELGWEIHAAPDAMPVIWDALAEAGAVPFGMYALNSMRIEKKNVHFRLGRIAQRQKRWDDAVTAFNRAIALDPDDVRPYQFLAEVNFAQQTFASAKSNYQKAIELGSKAPWVHIKLGRIAQQENNASEAIEYFQKAIALNDQNPQFHYFLGTAYQAQGDSAQASSSYHKALELNPQLKSAQNAIAGIQN